MAREIIINSPRLNPDYLASRTYQYDQSLVANKIVGADISPVTHPKAIDLFAGNGSVARLLSEGEWKEENIVCVDLCQPKNPLVERAQWCYWDLIQLLKAISHPESIPEEISQFRRCFDIVAIAQGPITSSDVEVLGGYFKSKDGVIIPIGYGIS